VAVPEGPYRFPSARFDPRQAGRVLRNRGGRLASLGFFGHMWELYAMWAWFLVFFSAVSDPGSGAAYATFAVIAAGAVGCWAGGVLGDRWGRPETTVLMMAVSGGCALLVGLAGAWSAAAALIVGRVWGFTVVADSAQFSTLVTELADQAYVGTALALQLAVGFSLTVATIWLVPARGGGLEVGVPTPPPRPGPRHRRDAPPPPATAGPFTGPGPVKKRARKRAASCTAAGGSLALTQFRAMGRNHPHRAP